MIKKILIAVDDSKYAENAAKYGFSLASSLDAEVGLVNIVEPTAIPMSGNGADEILGTPMQSLGLTDINLLEAQGKISENILANTVKQFGGKIHVKNFSEYGSIGERIVSLSIEFKADLIVMGTHERSGLDKLFSTDVAEYVIHHSKIPVLVVPGKE
jgi:nucleotide-binding universal stress UspA family protein